MALFAVLAGTLGTAGRVQALPTAPGLVCKEYADAPACSGQIPSCTLCHESVNPPSWNAFGTAVGSAFGGLGFDEGLPDALRAVEDLDSDEDGVSNLDELMLGSMPGDPSSLPDRAVPMDGGVVTPAQDAGSVSTTLPSGYDLEFAFRRISTLYCGRSPTFDQLEAFLASSAAGEDGRKQLHQTLDGCLKSDYWQKNALLRLADKRIKPQASIGPDTQIRIGGLRLNIGDYNYDYRLWRYIMSDDRDVRELLTADYHVEEGPDGALTQTRAIIAKPDRMALAGGQPLPPERRAGLITTQWFLSVNTMFSAVPRTTAAQAYRAYLGADISAGEGLIPVANEPSDIDKKGVAEPRCAGCHSTLDPLAYAFAKYEGIEVNYGLSVGSYRPERATQRIPGWDDAKQKPYVLGQPVQDLPEWARVASESDQFKRTMAETFYVHALGREPQGADQAEFNALWRSLPEDGYSANRLLHRLIDTKTFGAP